MDNCGGGRKWVSCQKAVAAAASDIEIDMHKIVDGGWESKDKCVGWMKREGGLIQHRTKLSLLRRLRNEAAIPGLSTSIRGARWGGVAREE